MGLPNKQVDNVLIVSITPYFLDKRFFWFEENLRQILKARKTQSFWQDNTMFLERDQKISISEVLRKLDEMGYEKVFKVKEQGEFSQLGGLIEIFPINFASAVRLDFLGNKIEAIEKLPLEVLSEETAKAILKKKLKSQKIFSDLKGLKPGDYLVHLDHGIGRFIGIQKVKGTELKVRNCKGPDCKGPSHLQFVSDSVTYTVPYISSLHNSLHNSFYALEYGQGDKLYVPVGLERKLSRYIGFIEPKLSRLGGTLWQKTKYKIKEETEKFAQELLAMFAEKEITKRPRYVRKELYEKLETSFPFSLTPDQSQVLGEIESDLSKETPMDRLVCGDVGFGKTEVALRAMVLAVENGKQSALMCPTTVLASQHFETFQKRLNGLAIKTAMLSRLQTAKEKKGILQELKDGKIDILIATHSILAKKVEFNPPPGGLGLLIIDDEQRFGVKQKEKLRQQHPQLDVLYLSATPIPRTLYMALSSLKEHSFIQTPPQGRKPIKTFVLPFKKEVVKKAIEQELKRNGQIYFLHNRVETISAFKGFLEELLNKKTFSAAGSKPADRLVLNQNQKESGAIVKIGILHAKLPEKEIIKVLNDFQKGKVDLLLATTIIENGLDISNANTLIVDNATRLGLAQAYQLRGRIGRSSRQSFAYFLYPHTKQSCGVGVNPKGALHGLAKKRLQALKQAEELGSGYKIATADLEIRGAGNILGREQSGAVNKVGLNLYCQLLNEAIEKIKIKPSLDTHGF